MYHKTQGKEKFLYLLSICSLKVIESWKSSAFSDHKVSTILRPLLLRLRSLSLLCGDNKEFTQPRKCWLLCTCPFHLDTKCCTSVCMYMLTMYMLTSCWALGSVLTLYLIQHSLFYRLKSLENCGIWSTDSSIIKSCSLPKNRRFSWNVGVRYRPKGRPSFEAKIWICHFDQFTVLIFFLWIKQSAIKISLFFNWPWVIYQIVVTVFKWKTWLSWPPLSCLVFIHVKPFLLSWSLYDFVSSLYTSEHACVTEIGILFSSCVRYFMYIFVGFTHCEYNWTISIMILSKYKHIFAVMIQIQIYYM